MVGLVRSRSNDKQTLSHMTKALHKQKVNSNMVPPHVRTGPFFFSQNSPSQKSMAGKKQTEMLKSVKEPNFHTAVMGHNFNAESFKKVQ